MMLDTELVVAGESQSRRLMIVLHGLGDSREGYRWLPSALRLPWLNYLLVNAPDDYYGGYSWYDYAGDAGPGIRRSCRLLFQLLDAQRAKGFATDQTLLFGFSQGGLLTIEVGLRYPHRFAGLIAISGYVFELDNLARELSPVAQEQRFLVTHGLYDPLLPIALVRSQIQQLQANKLQLEWREFPKEHTIAGEQELTVIRDFVRASFP
jgi:phospholipase/carboxylesterase